MLADRDILPEQVRRLTRWQVARILAHRRDEKGKIEPHYHPDRGGKPTTWEENLRRRLLRQKFPEHLLEGKLADLLAAYRAQEG